MTREELHTEVATLTGEIVGMVSDLSPFDYKRKAEIDKEILALFDRYERERGSGVADEAARFLYQLITETMILRGPYARQAMDIVTRWKEETERRELPPEEEPKA